MPNGHFYGNKYTIFCAKTQDADANFFKFFVLLLASAVCTNDLGNTEIVISQNSINAHIKEALSLLGIIRPKDIAEHAGRMCAVNHFLIKIWLEELNLLTAEFDATLNNLPFLTAAAAAATWLR